MDIPYGVDSDDIITLCDKLAMDYSHSEQFGMGALDIPQYDNWHLRGA